MTHFVSLAQLGDASFVGRLCETPQCVEDATTEPCISQKDLTGAGCEIGQNAERSFNQVSLSCHPERSRRIGHNNSARPHILAFRIARSARRSVLCRASL